MRGHPSHARKRRQQQERIRQRGAVAVDPTHRVGEPAQLAARACGAAQPRAVAPLNGMIAERAMVLARARRTTRTELGDVDLLDRVELGGRVRGQHARQAGREPGAEHDVQAALARFTIQLEQGADLPQRVAYRDDVRTHLQRRLGQRAVGHGRGQHDDVRAVEGLGGRGHLTRGLAERAHDIDRTSRL